MVWIACNTHASHVIYFLGIFSILHVLVISSNKRVFAMKDFFTENADVNGAGEEAVGGTAAARPADIELLPLERLTPYRGNARTHTKKQIRQIAESIRRFGFNNPVLIDDAGEIIAGHGRVEAAKLLGLDGVPTLRLSHLSGARSVPTSLPTISSPRRPAGTTNCSPSNCKG